jgi:hypothetical protein
MWRLSIGRNAHCFRKVMGARSLSAIHPQCPFTDGARRSYHLLGVRAPFVYEVTIRDGQTPLVCFGKQLTRFS